MRSSCGDASHYAYSRWISLGLVRATGYATRCGFGSDREHVGVRLGTHIYTASYTADERNP